MQGLAMTLKCESLRAKRSNPRHEAGLMIPIPKGGDCFNPCEVSKLQIGMGGLLIYRALNSCIVQQLNIHMMQSYESGFELPLFHQHNGQIN